MTEAMIPAQAVAGERLVVGPSGVMTTEEVGLLRQARRQAMGTRDGYSEVDYRCGDRGPPQRPK